MTAKTFIDNWCVVLSGNYRDYQSVGLGRFEGGVMLDLVKKGFFIREQFVNYQVPTTRPRREHKSCLALYHLLRVSIQLSESPCY